MNGFEKIVIPCLDGFLRHLYNPLTNYLPHIHTYTHTLDAIASAKYTQYIAYLDYKLDATNEILYRYAIKQYYI